MAEGKDREALNTICGVCDDHKALKQQVDFNYKMNAAESLRRDALVTELFEKTEANKEAIGKRIPIVHFIAIVGSVIGIISFLIGIQISANNSVDEKMEDMLKVQTETRTLVREHIRQSEQYKVIIEELRKQREDFNEALDKLNPNP